MNKAKLFAYLSIFCAIITIANYPPFFLIPGINMFFEILSQNISFSQYIFLLFIIPVIGLIFGIFSRNMGGGKLGLFCILLNLSIIGAVTLLYLMGLMG